MNCFLCNFYILIVFVIGIFVKIRNEQHRQWWSNQLHIGYIPHYTGICQQHQCKVPKYQSIKKLQGFTQSRVCPIFFCQKSVFSFKSAMFSPKICCKNTQYVNKCIVIFKHIKWVLNRTYSTGLLITLCYIQAVSSWDFAPDFLPDIEY